MGLPEIRLVYAAGAAPGESPPTVDTPRDAACVLAPLLEVEVTEVVGVLCLTTAHRVIGYHEVSRGTLNATLVHPRDVFRVALLTNAAAVVLAHNHPSGDPAASPEDAALTRRIKEAGDLLGIAVVDHVIVGHGSRYYSFREAGRL